uniref:Uncharacterized protein n=1 Tax=Melopsittacus undulatus TaxID=13146 RepID=A0A8V5GRC9_MELUD
MPQSGCRGQKTPEHPAAPALVPPRRGPGAQLSTSPPGGGGGRTGSAVERLEADKAKYVKSVQVMSRRQEPALRSRSPWLCSPGAQRALGRQQRGQSPGLRRGLRPEPLSHRQGRDCPDGDKENTEGSARPLCQGPGERPPAAQSPEPPVPTEEEEEGRTPGAGSGGGSSGIAVPGGSVVQKPALALRVSLPLSEQERFFNCCGLDRALVELLGRDRFVPGGWDNGRNLLHGSCESEPGQASGGSDGEVGPGQEEQDARLGSAVSVVERNARIIKWLYDCSRA